MKIGIIISTEDAETCWNALRFGHFSRTKQDEVDVFLIGRGVDFESQSDERFDVAEMAEKLLDAGGKIHACGSCLKLRNSGGSDHCPISTMEDMHRIVTEADRVVTF